jgi:hypothetical protein
MNRILREPLLHFVLLGAVIFAAYSLVIRGGGSRPGKIVITQGDVAAITEAFIRTRQRAPTRQELEGLLRDRVQDEVYAREAVALGLDQDDQIIRRRLRQKMEFVSEGLATPVEPTDAELLAYLDAHAAAYTSERRFSFRQVYLSPERHRTSLDGDVARLLARLNRVGGDTNLASLGDPILLERQYAATTAREVANLFGAKFAAALDSLPAGHWLGPVESGYGVHVVYVSERSGGPVPALSEVREAVRRDWADAREREAAARFYQGLLQKYTVVIDSAATPRNQSGLVGAR